MTEPERFRETLLFGKPDKIPFRPGDPRESTLEMWHKQGLPENMDWKDYVKEKIGVEPALVESLPEMKKANVWIKYDMIPWFEEKVVEEKENSLVVQDWKGNICEISNKYDVSYLRCPRDFVTRKWISCPVNNRDDWEAIKIRYNPDFPGRIPENIAELGKNLENRNYIIGFTFPGPFWQMREWIKAESLLMLFIEDPDFVKEMVEFWKNYISRLLEKVLPYLNTDYVHISEDIAFKEKSML